MKSLSGALIVSAIGLALVASPAEAAKKKKHPSHTGAPAYVVTPGGTAGTFQGGVLVGPLYNGQDYLGDDPDPNIRAYLMKDKSRYGGAR
jgi:hypothetical protein